MGNLEVKKSKPTTNDLKRSYTMSRIRGKDTSIEVSLRKALWKAGIRYRKNYSKLPGTPDIAITKHKIAIFCDGDFWHGKNWERTKGRIQSNREYWIDKIERNIERDNEVNHKTCGNGWRVMRFWGKEINDDLSGCVADVLDAVFQSNISLKVADENICKLYPCELLCRDSENREASELPDSIAGGCPFFESLAEMPCQNL